MVFNAPFNNFFSYIEVVSLLMEETGVPGENHWPVTSDKCCIGYTSPWAGFELKPLVVIGTDCTGSCKSNYHTITTPTASSLIDIQTSIDNTLLMLVIIKMDIAELNRVSILKMTDPQVYMYSNLQNQSYFEYYFLKVSTVRWHVITNTHAINFFFFYFALLFLNEMFSPMYSLFR